MSEICGPHLKAYPLNEPNQMPLANSLISKTQLTHLLLDLATQSPWVGRDPFRPLQKRKCQISQEEFRGRAISIRWGLRICWAPTKVRNQKPSQAQQILVIVIVKRNGALRHQGEQEYLRCHQHWYCRGIFLFSQGYFIQGINVCRCLANCASSWQRRHFFSSESLVCESWD